MAGLDSLANRYQPNNNLANAVIGGINSGREWAAQKALIQYRQAETQRQQQQLDMQRAQHLTQVTDRSMDNWVGVAQATPGSKMRKIKQAAAEQFDTINGITQGPMKELSKDPNFYVDTLQPLQQYLSGLKSGNPSDVVQGLQAYKNSFGDPKLLDNLIQTGAKSTSQEYKQTQGIQQRVQGQMGVAQFKHDLGPTAAQTTKDEKFDIKDMQNHLNTDSKKIDEKIRASDEAFAVFDKADKGNEAATIASGLTFAKSVMQGQRLTNPEVQKLSPMAASWYQQAKNWADKGFNGQIPAPSIEAAREVLQSTQDAAKQSKFNLQDQYADQYVQRAKVSGQTLSKNDAFERLTGKPYPTEDKTENHPMDNLPDDQKATLNQFIQKAQASGMKSDDIKKQIKQHLGVDFGDDDLKAASQYGQQPKPSSAAPSQPIAPTAPSAPSSGGDQVPTSPQPPAAPNDSTPDQGAQ